VILPEHSTTRSIAFGSVTWSSPITGRNEPRVNCAGCDTAALLRSIDFGVNTISGRCSSPSECRRSRWKYDAGLDG
jgi:hypothetical protein